MSENEETPNPTVEQLREEVKAETAEEHIPEQQTVLRFNPDKSYHQNIHDLIMNPDEITWR